MFILHAIYIATNMLGKATRMSPMAAPSNSEIYDSACRQWRLTRKQQLGDVKYVELGTFKPPLGAEEGMFSTAAMEAFLQIDLKKLRESEGVRWDFAHVIDGNGMTGWCNEGGERVGVLIYTKGACSILSSIISSKP
jgi:hypothetical protein